MKPPHDVAASASRCRSDAPLDAAKELLTGIEKMTFTVGTWWFDKVAETIVRVESQTPYFIVMDLGSEHARVPYPQHKLYRLIPLNL